MQHVPVKYPIVNVAVAPQNFSEEFAQEIIVGCFFESKFAYIIEINAKFLWIGAKIELHPSIQGVQAKFRRTWEAIAQLFDRCGLLFLPDLLVFLLVGGRLQALPGETAAQEIHEDVAQSLQVVSARLFWRRGQKFSQMSDVKF